MAVRLRDDTQDSALVILPGNSHNMTSVVLGYYDFPHRLAGGECFFQRINGGIQFRSSCLMDCHCHLHSTNGVSFKRGCFMSVRTRHPLVDERSQRILTTRGGPAHSSTATANRATHDEAAASTHRPS
ncbi:hypothetical protein [Stenotrophomonas phage BUCT603B1]|nr:hypothetical protein [Stenotrophomonas phage BUCT603B1]